MRVLLLALVTVTVGLAGCFTGELDPIAASDAVDLQPLPKFVNVTSVLDPDGGRGEPSFGVHPDGTLFSNGKGVDPVTGRSVMNVYRSSDGGASWENLGAPALTPDLDPDLAVDADGTIWADSLYVGCVSVAISQDKGETWFNQPAVCNGPVGDRQYIIPTQGGTAYLYYHQLPSFYQTAMKTTDHGKTWVPTGPVEFPDHHLLVNGGSGWGGGGFWNPVTDSVFFTFTWFEGSPTGDTPRIGSPGYSVTRDGGLTWQVGTVAEPWGRYLGLGLVVGAADEAGNVYMSWAEYKEDSNESATFLAVSKDDGKTWGAPIRVNTGNGSTVLPAITSGPAGQVAIAFYEADENGNPYTVSEKTKWNVTLAWTADALAETPVFESRTFSESIARTGRICPNGSGCARDRQFLDYFAIKRLPDGTVGGVYNMLEGGDGKILNVFASTADPVLKSS